MSKIFYLIIAACVIAMIIGILFSIEPDVSKQVHDFAYSLIGAGLFGIVVIVVLVKLDIIDLD